MGQSRMRGVSCLLVSCAVLAAGRPASAAPLLVEWQAPECASETAFRARVRDALQREPESALTSELQVSVRIGEIPEKSGYSLQIVMEAGSRQLELPSCEEALAAAATLVALAIDPQAVAPASTEPPPSTPPPPPAAAEPKPVEAERTPANAAPRWVPYAAAFGGVSLGEVPAASPLVGVGLGARLGSLGLGAEGFWIAPQTELVARTAKGGEIGLWGGGLVACYAPLTSFVRVSGCLGAQAGAWHSRGVGVTTPTEQSDWWLAGLGRLSAAAPVAGPLALFLAGDLLVPARQPRFKLAGVGQVFRPNSAAFRISAGFELSF